MMDEMAAANRPPGLPPRAVHPFIYEINTWPWLESISAKEGKPIDLGSVPQRYWDEIAGLGVDAVWLMGVWRRSPAGIAIALANPALRSDFQAALPDWRAEDVVGSPYCVRDYVVDDHLGGPAGLAAARETLAARGLRLILDFVPNHVAPDHPWTTEAPELFVSGTAADLGTWIRRPSSRWAAGCSPTGGTPTSRRGRMSCSSTPSTPPCASPVIETLIEIADQCDGVRCDMAMLVMNDVFARTWGDRVGPAPSTEYWPTVIPPSVRPTPTSCSSPRPTGTWSGPCSSRASTTATTSDCTTASCTVLPSSCGYTCWRTTDYQHGLVRFVENHDEPRALSAFGAGRSQVAAVAALTQTGARLVHNGQLEGGDVHLPVFLGRFPDEPTDGRFSAFYHSALAAVADPTFRDGRWQLCERSGWPGRRQISSTSSPGAGTAPPAG